MMKKILLSLLTVVSLISCNIKEEMYINKDGSGNVNYQVDFGAMMGQLAAMGKGENGSSKLDEKIDTIISFKDIIEKNKDSVSSLPKQEQELLTSLKDFNFRMQMDAKEGIGVFAMTSDFDLVNKMNNLNEIFQKASSRANKKSPKKNSVEKYGFKFEYKGKEFRRIVYENKLTDEEEKKYQDQLKSGKMIFAQSKYTLLYHFERKVKKVSNKDAKILKDKKTIEITYPMDSILKNPYLLNFEVKLK